MKDPSCHWSSCSQKKGCEADSSNSSRPIHYSFPDSAAPYGSGPLLGSGFLPFLFFFTPIHEIHMVMKQQSTGAVLRAGLSSRLQASSWCPPSDSTGLMSGFFATFSSSPRTSWEQYGHLWKSNDRLSCLAWFIIAPYKPLCPVCHSASPDSPDQFLVFIKT